MDNILHINRNLKFNINNWGLQTAPYSYPDMNEDLKYLATYKKGKKSQENRLLMSGVNTGTKYFMFPKEDFGAYFLEYIPLEDFKQITEGHYKFKVYNYYFFREDSNDVNLALQEWLDNTPKPFQYSSFKINHIEDYSHLFEFNDKKY